MHVWLHAASLKEIRKAIYIYNQVATTKIVSWTSLYVRYLPSCRVRTRRLVTLHKTDRYARKLEFHTCHCFLDSSKDLTWIYGVVFGAICAKEASGKKDWKKISWLEKDACEERDRDRRGQKKTSEKHLMKKSLHLKVYYNYPKKIFIVTYTYINIFICKKLYQLMRWECRRRPHHNH